MPHRSGGLKLVDGLGPRRPVQALHAFGDGAAAHHDHLSAVLDEGSQLFAPLADGLSVESTAFISDQAGAHLDHNAFGAAQDGGACFFLHI